MPGPLEGILAIEVAQGVCGPFCAMHLADSGCRVIKVEPIAGDIARAIGPPFVGDESALFLSLNRNKQSIAVDLDHPEGQAIVARLAQTADIFLEDLGPGGAEKCGLGYDHLATVNPRLIYAAISPFGERGPMRDSPGAELVVQALSDYQGSLGALGEAPIRVGADVAAINTAAITGQAILAALFQRTRTGRGQRVSNSMLGSLLHLRGIMWASLADPDEWYGVNLDTYIKPPDYGYRTKDRPVYVSLGRGTTDDWYNLLVGLDMLDVFGDPRFDNSGRESLGSGRFAHEVKGRWEAAFSDKTAAEVLDLIEGAKGRGAPINDYEALAGDPQVAELGLIVDIPLPGGAGTLKGIGVPWEFSETPADAPTAPPRQGEHTDEILRSLGYSLADIVRLREAGVIR